jgi:hypothetical protein
MAKIAIQTTLDIPSGVLTYDLGAEQLLCRQCGTGTTFQIIDSPSTRHGGVPSVEATFKNFVTSHAACVTRYNELRRLDAERVNSERGGPGDR